MKKEIITKLHADFEQITKIEEETRVEFWLARDIQILLGYAKWDNFFKVINKAKISCETSGYDQADHFLGVGKMITIGKASKKKIAQGDSITQQQCYDHALYSYFFYSILNIQGHKGHKGHFSR